MKPLWCWLAMMCLICCIGLGLPRGSQVSAWLLALALIGSNLGLVVLVWIKGR